jgi:hypothetical protein
MMFVHDVRAETFDGQYGGANTGKARFVVNQHSSITMIVHKGF